MDLSPFPPPCERLPAGKQYPTGRGPRQWARSHDDSARDREADGVLEQRDRAEAVAVGPLAQESNWPQQVSHWPCQKL